MQSSDAVGQPKTYTGLYLICDGGYHKWRVLQCPNKHSSDEGCIRFSERLESVRKDAECTFGILKKRWRILKNHILIRKKARIDNIVFTCAILHNMLIEYDKWEDEDDLDDIAADMHELRMDERIVNIRNGPADRSYAGGGNIMQPDVEVENEWSILREKLIQNYMHCFRANKILW